MEKANSNALDPDTKWSTYEANVQAYRSNMIASQSFLLAVGAILVEKNVILLSICIVVALFQLWYIWFGVIRTRTIIADFYKFRLFEKFDESGMKIESNKSKLGEDTYLKNIVIRRKVNAQIADDENKRKLKHNLRLTRVKFRFNFTDYFYYHMDQSLGCRHS